MPNNTVYGIRICRNKIVCLLKLRERNFMTQLKSVCVFCGSSNRAPELYKAEVQKLGELIAKSGVRLVYGGGASGLMGLIADAAIRAGGKVVGVMTNFLFSREGQHTHLTELLVVESMHERKLNMYERSDAFIIFPGGVGTLDEAFEILTWKQIGLHKKNIVFINIDGYWNPLIEFFQQKVVGHHFAREEDKHLFQVVDSVEQALPALGEPPVETNGFVSKWG